MLAGVESAASVVKAQGSSFPWSMQTLVLVEHRLQICNIFDILIQTQEKPRSITRSPMAMVDGRSSASLGSLTSCSHLLNSFGGIPAGRADYHNNFNHRGFCSTRVPPDAHDVGRSRRIYDDEVSADAGYDPPAR